MDTRIINGLGQSCAEDHRDEVTMHLLRNNLLVHHTCSIYD